MYDAVSLLEEHGQADMLLEELVAFEVITRMQLGRIFRGHTCEGPPDILYACP